MSYTVFNSLLGDFMGEMLVQFPGCTDLRMLKTGLVTLSVMDERRPARLFVDALRPRAELVASRDPVLFEDLVIGEVDFSRLWHAITDDQTREAVMEHVYMLFMLGSHLLATQT